MTGGKLSGHPLNLPPRALRDKCSSGLLNIIRIKFKTHYIKLFRFCIDDFASTLLDLRIESANVNEVNTMGATCQAKCTH